MQSFFKFLLIAGACYGVYYLYKKGKSITSHKGKQKPIETMEKCPICGVYFSAGSPHQCKTGDGA
jgi:hypothetical protein